MVDPKPGMTVRWTAEFEALILKRTGSLEYEGNRQHHREFKGRTGILLGPMFEGHPEWEWDVRWNNDDGTPGILKYGYPLTGLEEVQM